MMRSIVRRGVWIIGALVCACGQDGAPPQHTAVPPRGPLVGPAQQVVLVTVDTLRTSHLGCYGYERDTSPYIDRLAREGIQMMRAYSPVPRTTPAHMSMMTGLSPTAHGAMRNAYAISRADAPSLPAFLRDRGYATGAFVSVPFLNPNEKRLSGFDHVEAPPVGVQWRSRNTLKRASAWVRAHAAEPFFLWIHTYDMHKPYKPPKPYDSMFWKQAPVAYEPPRDGLLTGPPPTPEEAAYMRALYDGEIRYTDDALRSFFDELDDLWNTPLVILTADHGEILEEHAHDFQHVYFHGKFPFNESLRVPLIWHWPGHLPPGRRDAPVDIAGLAPTLVDLLFGGGFPGGVPSFASVVREDAPGDTAVFALAPRLYPEETMQPGWEFRRHETWSILRWPWHLIYNPDRRSALYNVETDPLELTDLAASHPTRVAALEQEVIQYFRAQPRTEEGAVPVSAELREQLRELGYVE